MRLKCLRSAHSREAVLKRREMMLLSGAAVFAGCTSNTGFLATRNLRWREGPSLPAPKQKIYPALHNGEIWLTGGFIAREGRIVGPTNETLILDPRSGVWREGPGIPAPRHHPQLLSPICDVLCERLQHLRRARHKPRPHFHPVSPFL